MMDSSFTGTRDERDRQVLVQRNSTVILINTNSLVQKGILTTIKNNI